MSGSTNFLCRGGFSGEIRRSILLSLFRSQGQISGGFVAGLSFWVILCFLVLDSRSCLIAYPTMSSALIGVGVLWSEFVPVHAMGLRSMTSTHSESPQKVFTRSNYLQMARIYTSSVAAKVINMTPPRNTIPAENEGHSVSRNRLSLITELAVSSLPIDRSSPRPTRILTVAGIAFTPESVHGSILEWRKISVH